MFPPVVSPPSIEPDWAVTQTAIPQRPVLKFDVSKIELASIQYIDAEALRSVLQSIKSGDTKLAQCYSQHSNTGRGTPTWSSYTNHC